MQRSVAPQDDEWQVPAAAVIGLQNLTGCSQPETVYESFRLTVSSWLVVVLDSLELPCPNGYLSIGHVVFASQSRRCPTHAQQTYKGPGQIPLVMPSVVSEPNGIDHMRIGITSRLTLKLV